MSHWSEHHKEYPFGTPEPFELSMDEIVEYMGQRWGVTGVFRKTQNVESGEIYENPVFAAYELTRYHGLNTINHYITRADMKDIKVVSRESGECFGQNTVSYSTTYLKLIGKSK